MLEQWVVVEHIDGPRIRPQTLLQVRDHPLQPRLWKRIEQKEHHRLGGKRKLSRIRADRFQREALLRFASILAQILLSSLMQRWQKFYSDDTAKGILRRHQQGASFARSQIDEDEVAKF